MANPNNDYLELFVDDAGEHRWRRRDGANHQIVSTSGEGYVSRSYCESAALAYNAGCYIAESE